CLGVGGNFHQGKGNVELIGENLDIRLFSQPFGELFRKDRSPVLQQGRLSFQGQLQVPERNFQGDVQLKDLLAENQQGTGLSWKNGEAKQVLVGMQPFFMHIDELVLQEPKLKTPSPKDQLPGVLTSLLRIQEQKPALPPFTVQQCRIQGGTMPGDSQGREFTAVNGRLAPLISGTPASFTFSGKVNEREFTAQGRLEQNHAEVDNFTVAELSLDTAAKKFADQLGLEKQGKIRWVPATEQQDKGRIHFSSFLPPLNSDFALLLAMLTDSEGTFTLPLSLSATASPAEISTAALKKLQRLHLQAVVSPQAVLEKELPDLTLPERINFIVGDSLPDFMDDLENFAPLFTRRPYLRLELRGCYDDTADRSYLLRLLQEEADYRVNLENTRREEQKARLLAEEELRQVELLNTDMPIGEDLIPVIEARADLQPLPRQIVQLPKKILPELARQRARVVQEYLVDTLKLPAEKITLTEPGPGGPRVEIFVKANWKKTPENSSENSSETPQVSEEGEG
ncbi:MAG: hypothetical protein D3909_09300, partial [Candidatus Electrothrix sp. ATG1]|nr:hypothetical protein [Candidatus Electrothrix sp. ATG1]